MLGILANNKINDNGVALPVISQAQMVMAKSVISEPKIEINCPIQIVTKGRRLAGILNIFKIYLSSIYLYKSSITALAAKGP